MSLRIFSLDPKEPTFRRAYNQACPLNMKSLPEDDLPVSTIIAEYAKDQVKKSFLSAVHYLVPLAKDLWFGDFIEAFEKMMGNGYKKSDLTEAPKSWENVLCRLPTKNILCS